MEPLITVVVLGIFFLGYCIYQIEAELRETNTQLKQIIKALDPQAYGSIGYKVVDNLEHIKDNLRN